MNKRVGDVLADAMRCSMTLMSLEDDEMDAANEWADLERDHMHMDDIYVDDNHSDEEDDKGDNEENNGTDGEGLREWNIIDYISRDILI